MQERGIDEQRIGERILAQSAALFSQRGNAAAVQLLRTVQRLEFEETDNGYVTDTNWHDYYWAAVFFVPAHAEPRFTDNTLQSLLPTVAEVARQNGKPPIDSILIRPALPDVDENWRQTYAPPQTPAAQGPGAATASRITGVTRRRIVDLLEGTDWYGRLDETDFLERLYDLEAMESHDRRFPTASGDIIQHRYNNPLDWDDDWVFHDDRFGLNRGPDATLLRFLAEMLHPEVRTDATEAQGLLAALNELLARDGYALVEHTSISGYPAYEGRTISPPAPHAPQNAQIPTQPAPPPAAAAPTPASHTPVPPGGPESAVPLAPRRPGPTDGYEQIRRAAHGERKDYALDRVRWKEGGQADIFLATHKPSRTRVAFKRRRSQRDTPIARMRREIDVARVLDGHPHYMPILDSGPAHDWFVMPVAEATAEEHREHLRDTQQLRLLVDALASVLAEAHRGDWLHRDIKPSNILLLQGRWTLADWGIVRRPRGQTTVAGRTGMYLGTEGFGCP
jgi:hypothetical protein